MTYQRKCENWLASWMEWTMPRSQAPETTLFWSGLFTLTCALRRRVKLGEKYLGGWECYPSMFVIFVADAGVINKSTTIGFSEKLLSAIPQLKKCPQEITVPIVLQQLQESPDSSIYMMISEFGTVMEKAGDSMYTKLIDAFDNRKIMDEATISRGKNLVENPCVNLIAATTPDWIVDNMPPAILQGGFGSRVIWLYEKAPRRKKLLYHDEPAIGKNPELFQYLMEDLIYIAENISGEFEFDSRVTADFLESWFQKNSDPPEGSGKGIKGYYVRRPAYVIKLAMLLHISYSDTLILTQPDIEAAISLMHVVEEKVKNTFKSVGKNKYILTMEEMVSFIKENKRVSSAVLRRTFNADAEPIKYNELISGLEAMDFIQSTMDKGVTWYSVPQ
jgi:hypothetical protein